jgi:flagellar protein FlbD
MDGAEMVLNAHLIEMVEATPDTIISLTTGRKVLVRDSVGQVIHKVIAFERRVHGGLSRQKKERARRPR